MRVLLTGCEGFIGKRINDTLMKHSDVISVVGIEKDYMNHSGWETALFKAVSLCDVVLHVGAISDTMLKDPNEMMKYNVYGPGESHKGKMASVAHQAHLRGEFKLFDGKPQRDFVYIDDVVDATIYPIFNDVADGVYEVGSGEARSFENVLELMEIPYEYKDESEIPEGYQFYTKSYKNKFMGGWKPKHNLEKGIKKYKEYLLGDN